MLSRAPSLRCAPRSIICSQRTIFVCLAAALCSSACGETESATRRPEGEPPRPADDERAPASPEYRVVEVEEPGSIAGAVTWVGEVPEIAALPVRVHADVCGEQPSPALRVGARAGVADTVVSLVEVSEGVAMEASAAPEVVHERCRFVPHVLAVGVGTAIAFRNDDSVLHNVHGLRDERTVWDFGQPERGAVVRRTADEAGIIRIVCDVHSWTGGWIHVFPHPYFAVTDADGRYRIAGVPAGQYVLRVWHEGWRILGTASGRPRYSSPVVLTRSVSVAPREETSIDFELSQQLGEAAGD